MLVVISSSLLLSMSIFYSIYIGENRSIFKEISFVKNIFSSLFFLFFKNILYIMGFTQVIYIITFINFQCWVVITLSKIDYYPFIKGLWILFCIFLLIQTMFHEQSIAGVTQVLWIEIIVFTWYVHFQLHMILSDCSSK